MRSRLIILALIGSVPVSYAREPKPYKTGQLMRMDAVHCGTTEKDAKSLTGELLGTDSSNKKSEEMLCQEYVIQTDSVVYHVRPRDEKHPLLLPVGGRVQFRLEKDKMVVRVEDVDNKDHDYSVVSMVPRSDTTASVSESQDARQRLTKTR
jgi:hypothetical protein